MSLVASTLAVWQWSTSVIHRIDSVALQEARVFRVFNPYSKDRTIYLLDGGALRNSLAPAVIFSVAAILQGRDPPKIVAVYSNANRDRDFRPVTSTPTYWRPRIVGRSPSFDAFLMLELIPQIEDQRQSSTRRYILGHSLSGLYVLDLATRFPGRFAGVLAFAPTFSHDTTIGARLPISCDANTLLYANWGLESSRDTEVFVTTVTKWQADRRCNQRPPISPRHYGSLHQIVMLTGQLHAAFLLFD